MKVKSLFNNVDDISIDNYLKIKGVEDVEEYLTPTNKYMEQYLDYCNILDAVQILKYHHLSTWTEGKTDRIYIVVDSDVDGYTSATMLYMYLKQLDNEWDIKFLIHNGKERGLQDDNIFNKIINEPRELVIIPDAGSNDKKQADELKRLNTSLIVLDHHDIADPIDYGVLVNNQVNNVDKYGSGCAVTFMFLKALDVEFGVNYANKYLDLVMLSTISDCMNMTSQQNRKYFYYGIKHIHNKLLKKLFEKKKLDKNATQRDVAFKIVPLINAVCRGNNLKLKQDVILGLIGKHNDYDLLVDQLIDEHKEQSKRVETYIENHIDDINTEGNVIIHCDNDIIRSYSGLIAGKICGMYNKPVILGKQFNDVMIGSVRSTIPLRELLDNSGLVNWARGHEAQFGVSIDVKNIDELRDSLKDIDIQKEFEVLYSFTVSKIPKKLFKEFEQYETLWGQSLEKPKFYIHDIIINSKDIDIIGSNKRTIKFNKSGVDFLIFNCLKKDKTDLCLGEYVDDCFVRSKENKKLKINCIGYLTTNEWRGNIKPQIIIERFEVENKEIKLENLL